MDDWIFSVVKFDSLDGRAAWHLDRENPDPCFTPGSTPGFGPDSESNSVAVSSNKNTEPLDFTLLAS